MLKNAPQINPTPRSKINLIIGVILILIIVGLVAYGLLLFYKSVQTARQQYYNEVANLKKKDIQITIIEGWRREQIAAKLVDLEILSSPDEFLELTKNFEGKLFPDTYRFFSNSTASEVIKKITDNFATKLASLKIDNQTLILASIIEREAANDEERALISGIYKNRLDEGMKLEADPTAQYARDSQQIASRGVLQYAPTIWAPITKEQIDATESPYNTYKHIGLPPRPICNPGLKSINAATSPELSQYFYFFHDSSGVIRLSRNLVDHKYQMKIYGVRK